MLDMSDQVLQPKKAEAVKTNTITIHIICFAKLQQHYVQSRLEELRELGVQ